MSTPLLLVIIGFAIVAGVALGWYLRPMAAWCPACGASLVCVGCGHRAANGLP